MTPAFMAHVVPGLERFAVDDMRRRLGEIEVTRTLQRFDERTSLIVFRYGGDPRSLLELRSTEDVFALCLSNQAVPADRRALPAIRSQFASDPSIPAALTVLQRVRPWRGRATFRVVARASGAHQFRRVDVQTAVELGLRDRFPAWRLSEEGHIEVWVQLVGAVLVAGFRLSDIAMRNRTYRPVTLPAALKPTVAYAMVALSDPQATDVFLDPMCGSGTILLERAHAARYLSLLGGDIDPEAVRVTCENIGKRYQPVEIRRWDATSLPLESGSVSALVCNLPFGKQIGSREGNRDLYPALLREWERVLMPRGRAVLLTSERSLMRRSLEQRRELRENRQVSVLVRGQEAMIHVIERR
jgi:tRNA (guanine6-N2)-methyltransferase